MVQAAFALARAPGSDWWSVIPLSSMVIPSKDFFEVHENNGNIEWSEIFSGQILAHFL